jgi:hypothetical protein
MLDEMFEPSNSIRNRIFGDDLFKPASVNM